LISTQPPTFEEAWRDFKGASHLTVKELASNGLKEIWSKALGAMANTEGGVLIWGIRADKDPMTKVDAARDLSLCPDVNALTSRLKELLPSVTSPPVLDVEIFPVPTTGSEGFVVCHIPRSRFGPHRSEASGKRFLARFQDHSEDIPVDWLRRMFTPEIRPHLVPFVSVSPTKTENFQDVFKYTLALRNDGSGTAESVFVICNGPSGLPDQRCWSLDASAVGGRPLLALRAIHPGEILPLYAFKFTQGHLAEELELRLHCKNQLPTSFFLKIKDPAMHSERGQFDLPPKALG
jgi:hypothetical protein